MPWDSDTDNRLRTKWTQGLPTRLIASDLGTTNGAVAGRARRLGLPFRSGPKSAAGHAAFSKREAKKRRQLKAADNPFGGSKVFERAFRRIEEKMLAKDGGRVGVPLLVVRDGVLHANEALGVHSCKWPLASGFCGKDAIRGASYCAPHLMRSSAVPIKIPTHALPLPQPSIQLMLFPSLPLVRRNLVKVA